MEKKRTILVTGSNGQLGTELRELAAQHPAYQFAFVTRHELPLHTPADIKRIVRDIQPDYVVNCAAYTAVDKAESDREEAFQINARAVEALAEVCLELNAKFIHISTDYVFDGTANRPLKEDDGVKPVNYYGESKLAGEQFAQKANPDSVIIRTSWVYSHHGKNFVKTMIRLMAEKETLHVVNDQIGSPTYAADLAAAILSIIEAKTWHPGIYHFSNEAVITWFDFATEIAAQIQTGCVVLPTSTANFPTPAKRPAYAIMDKRKIAETYGIALRNWKDSLATCVQKLKDNASFH